MTKEEVYQERKEKAIVHIWIFLKLKGYKTVDNILNKKIEKDK